MVPPPSTTLPLVVLPTPLLPSAMDTVPALRVTADVPVLLVTMSLASVRLPE